MRCTITWPIWIDPVSKDLLQRLLVLTPAHRMSRAGDVKEHRWFKSINWTVILAFNKADCDAPWGHSSVGRASFKGPSLVQLY